MERPDWESAITTPIGILPVGSGNSLCASLLYEAEYVSMLCVCVCVCVCISMHVCVYASVRVHLCQYVCVCM